ncbi:MAG: sulfatase-like hydrolase/transferase [Phycisphaeraceae bacterium]
MPPNILLITSDQQHYSTLGSVNPKIKTPALDRLAAQGTRFDRAYCPNPLSSPSRSSIITGMYPSQHGCWTIGVKLPEDVPTVGQHLHKLGYQSSLIGKAHFQPLASQPGSESIECQPLLRDLDFWRQFHGPWYGFDHVETARMHTCESHAGQHYALWMEEKGLTNWRDFFDPWPPDPSVKKRPSPGVWELPDEYHYNRWIQERTIANIEASIKQGQPFFSWASFFDPHYPQVTPDPWYSMYDPADMEPGTLEEGEMERMPPAHRQTVKEKADFSAWAESFANHGYHSHTKSRDRDWLRRTMAAYYGMVSFMDDSVGHILTALDRLGVADNTIVIYSTDHGDFLGQHGLHMKGAFHYEDLIRIPMLVRWPGQVPAGRSSTAMQSLIDLAPTFLAAAGGTVPGQMQGVNQMPVWTGQSESARDHVMVENRHQPTKVHLRTYVNERYKITLYRGQTYGELFDLVEDPDERRNLWDAPAAAAIKCEMLHRQALAEIAREPTRMPRIAGA